MSEAKRYVTVNADQMEDGTLRPCALEWNGVWYPVEEIRKVEHFFGSARTEKKSYTVVLRGLEKILYREGERWYLLIDSHTS